MIKINNKIVDFKRFNDGTLRLDYEYQQSTNNVEPITITWLYDSDIEISELFFLVHHLKSIYHLTLNLELPFVNSARMDRCKIESECFTLKYFCDFINDLQFNKVTIYDPHSRVAAGLLNNVKVISSLSQILDLMSRLPNITLCFPDIGAMEKYGKMFEDNIYFAFGVKDRDWDSQKIKSLTIIDPANKVFNSNILLCDDILSRGSTIYLAATRLKELGARNIYVYVSHCENTVLDPHINGHSLLDIPNLIERVYTTNSIYRLEHPKIEVIHNF